MKYDIKKDAKPKDTVARIKKILDKVGIKTTISCSARGENYYSARITIKGTNIGTNGKGTCKINALASGYAEFMERLQNQFLFDFQGNFFVTDSDEKLFDIENFKEKNILDYYKKNDFDFQKINFLYSWTKNREHKIKENKFQTIPYVSLKNKQIHYLPSSLSAIQASNGLAAGNTYEEASVQSLSEIIERYCCKQIITNQLNLPTIPKKYYEKYKTLSSLIKELEEDDYKITFKDASLGKGFPTVCCIIEDLRHPKNGICIKFGAHPFFPIALERCLTEFTQGFEQFKKHRYAINTYNLPNDTKLKKVIRELSSKTTFFKKTNKYIASILETNCKDGFNKEAWCFSKRVSNKTLFKKLYEEILKHSDDIYIRNYGFLNFPAVQIFVPSISNPYITDKNYFEKLEKVQKWVDFSAKKSAESFSLENLIETCNFICFENEYMMQDTITFGAIEARYIGFYCSILTKNKKNIKRYLRLILQEHYMPNNISLLNKPMLKLFQGFKLFFKLHFAKVEENLIKEKIEKQFSNTIYDEIMRTLNNLTFDYIKNVMRESGNYDNSEIINELSRKLHVFYWDSPPNQNKILDMLNNSNIFKKIYNRLCPHK